MSAAPIPGVLDPAERDEVQRQFGVTADQVIRDHVISHTLAALAAVDTDAVVFLGGTALSRTLLPFLRLSEDIDLVALRDRAAVASSIESAISRGLRRSFGTVSFSPSLPATSHPSPSVMRVGDARVQVQLLSGIGYPAWPTEIVDLVQRYSDAPPARLRVLTPPAFVAAKLSAWTDRRAARDLYDLWALAHEGFVDSHAVALFSRWGPVTSARAIPFDRLPTPREWREALSHQCVIAAEPDEAAEAVRRTLARLGG